MAAARDTVVALLLILVSGGALAVALYGSQQTARSTESIETQTRVAAEQAVDLTVAGLENTMLQGTGVTVSHLLERAHALAPDAHIHIYDARGYEVFGKKKPPPERMTLKPEVARVLGGAARTVSNGVVFRPIDDEERCKRCHTGKSPLRGVLEFRPQVGTHARRYDIVPELIRGAFVHVMTSKNASMLDDFFAELNARAPSVVAVGVYGNDAELRFGVGVAELVAAEISPVLAKGSPPRTVETAGNTTVLVPLPNSERCKLCHEDPNPVRGVLAVTLAPLALEAADLELEAVIDSSIRVMMMSSLGRMILLFMERVVELGAISELVIYDSEGRTYYDAAPPSPPTEVAAILAEMKEPPNQSARRENGRFAIVRSLLNKEACTTCHGIDSKLRGVVTMSVSSASTDELIESASRTQLFFLLLAGAGGLVVLLGVFVLLRGRRR